MYDIIKLFHVLREIHWRFRMQGELGEDVLEVVEFPGGFFALADVEGMWASEYLFLSVDVNKMEAVEFANFEYGFPRAVS